LKFKFLSIGIGIVVVATFSLYFFMSHSYKLSLEAKVHYYLSDYDKAYKLAKQAHDADSYNRMAATVMTQSQLALEYVVYHKDALEYLEKIKELSKAQYIDKADKIRMKFMAEIMIERHEKLTPTVVIDVALKEQAKSYFLEFKKIHEKVINSL
jgi:tetratricopeptide (TPR) repeat protein